MGTAREEAEKQVGRSEIMERGPLCNGKDESIECLLCARSSAIFLPI